MNSPACLLIYGCAALLLASCETSTMPTASDMDRYYKKAEEISQDRIARLEGQRRRGEITQAEFDEQSAQARTRVMDHATELAWARHENIEARKRAMGIPTGDSPQQINVPGAGSGESFYRRAGEQGGSSLNNNTPFGGSVFGGPNRGERAELPPPTKAPGGEPEAAPVQNPGS